VKTQTIHSRVAVCLSMLVLIAGFTAPGFCEPGAGAFGPVRTAAKARTHAVRLDQGAEPAPGSASSKPFLKTPKGVVAVVLMAGVSAWLVQSRIHNKVVSPGRQ
jgi:hypothetical protein